MFYDSIKCNQKYLSHSKKEGKDQKSIQTSTTPDLQCLFSIHLAKLLIGHLTFYASFESKILLCNIHATINQP